jgi:hypothetical protein
MSREPLIADEALRRGLVAREPARPDDASARLVHLEAAYAELLRRVRSYERERREIKARLARILARIPHT